MNLNEMARQGTPAQDPTVGSTGGQKPASAQQQAQFDMLLGRARQMMGEQAQAWREAMGIDPAQAAVRMGTQTLRFLAMESQKAGQPVDPAVLLHAGVQLVKDIAGLANDAGLVPDEQLEPFLQQVMQESIAEYMRMDADEGLMPRPEDLRQGAEPPAAPGARGVGQAQRGRMVPQQLQPQGGVQ